MSQRSNLPQYGHAYEAEDEWDRRRDGGVIDAARGVIPSRLIAVSTLNDSPIGRLFLETSPPVIRWQGADYVPREPYRDFREACRDLVRMEATKTAAGPHRTARPTSIYFIQAPTREIKIGVACDARARMRELQTAHAGRLRLLGRIDGDLETESTLHRQFASLRLGGEWFSPGPELLAFIETACGSE